MIQYAPRLGRKLSRLALGPFMVVSLMFRMRHLQAQTLSGVSDAIGTSRVASFLLYVRSLYSFIGFSVDYMVTCARGPSEIMRQMSKTDIDGAHHFAFALATERPILVVTMHMGDFQIGFLKLVERLRPGRQLSVFKLSDKSLSEAVLLEAFASLGHKPIVLRAGEGGGRQAYLALRKAHIVAITIDLELQVTSRSTVSFFGRPCHMQNGPATIAALTRSLIVPVVNFKDRQGRRIVQVSPPIDSGTAMSGSNMHIAVQQLTQQLADCMEAWIRIDPSQVQAWSAIAETISHPIPPVGH